MIEAYVLILYLHGEPPQFGIRSPWAIPRVQAQIVMQEFNSQAMCETARDFIISQAKRNDESYPTTICVKK